jgi:hypothetical protein
MALAAKAALIDFHFAGKENAELSHDIHVA